MSWLSGYKSKDTLADEREARRKKLEAETQDRLERQRQRASRQKQLQAAVEAREEADKALKDLLDIDPSILDGDTGEIDDSASDILNATPEANMPNNEAAQVNFEDENGEDSNEAMQKACQTLAKFNWDQGDLLFTFSQMEVKMATAGVKKNWTKFQVLTHIIPKTVQDQVNLY